MVYKEAVVPFVLLLIFCNVIPEAIIGLLVFYDSKRSFGFENYHFIDTYVPNFLRF